MRQVNWIVIHGSGDEAGAKVDARELDRRSRCQQMLANKYHWVIREDGMVEQGRPEADPAPHAGRWNPDSVAVCLVGGMVAGQWANTYTDQQRESLEGLLTALIYRYPSSRILTYRDLTQDGRNPGATYQELGLGYDRNLRSATIGGPDGSSGEGAPV